MKNSKGFTLIELMLLLAIIGVLAATVISAGKRVAIKKRCVAGDTEACIEYTKLTGKTVDTEAAAQVTPVPPVKVDQGHAETPVKFKRVKGRIIKVSEPSEGGDQYNAVISLDNATAMSITVRDIVVEGTTVCVDISPDRNRQDIMVVCE